MVGIGLARTLDEVRARAPEYRRWWCREYGGWSGPPRPAQPIAAQPNGATAGSSGGATALPSDVVAKPWSDQDEERAATVASVDPWWMRSVADELERAHTDLREVAVELGRLADSAIGASASTRCAALAATGHERASEAAALAAGTRSAADRAGEVLDDLTRRLAEVLEGGVPGWRAGRSEPGWGGYTALLHAVRTELNWAIDRLPILVGLHPNDRAETGGRLTSVDPTGWTPQPGGATGWTAEPGTGPVWSPEPGTGPQLPATDARRVETDTGVRIARLPDRPR